MTPARLSLFRAVPRHTHAEKSSSVSEMRRMFPLTRVFRTRLKEMMQAVLIQLFKHKETEEVVKH